MTPVLTDDPTQLIDVTESVNGRRITIRPFLKQDHDLQRNFFAALSQDSRYLRFMTPASGLSERQLSQLSRVDHRMHSLLVATAIIDGEETMIAEARFVTSDTATDVCEFAICISEHYRGHGLGHRLMNALERHAKSVGFNRIVGETFAHNHPMIELARSAGYALSRNAGDLTRTCMTKALAPAGCAWRVSEAPYDVLAA